MQLYFGDKPATITTLMLIVMAVYIAVLLVKRDKIKSWGRHLLIMDLFGVDICCYAATRDGFHLTVQNAIDQSVSRGLFPLISIPTVAGYIGAAMILGSAITCLFKRDQRVRKILCFITMGGIGLKVLVIELSRILM